MKLGELLKGGAQEGKEKHVPVIELVECKDCGERAVKITVGKEVPHPNTVEHHIKWIALFGVRNGVAVHIATFDLGPTFGVPIVVTHAKLDGLSELIAVEYCNVHGLWESAYSLP
jgi:superoxide reductase